MKVSNLGLYARRPVIMYFINIIVLCHLFIGRLYALQRGMEIDKKSTEGRTFLVALMDLLEVVRHYYFCTT